MTSVFLLINCLIGFQNHIVKELRRLSVVRSSDHVMNTIKYASDWRKCGKGAGFN